MVVVKASPTLIGLFTFMIHTKVFKNELTASAGFTALALFNQLRVPLAQVPDTINYYIQVCVCVASNQLREKFVILLGICCTTRCAGIQRVCLFD